MPDISDPGVTIDVARYSITVDGVEVAQFPELVAITSEAEPEDLAGKVLKKIPGKRNPPTVTLRRGLTADMQLSAWHEQVVEHKVHEARKDAELVMYATDGSPVARYHLENAWPSKLEVGARQAGAGDVLMETIVVQCDRIRRVTP